MWTSKLAIAIAAMTLTPRLASATTYNFQATETSALSPSPVSFTFSLDTSTAYLSRTDSTTFPNVAIEENTATFPGNTVDDEFGTDLSSPLFFLIDTSSTPFTSGSGTAISFNIGSFAIADGATDGEGTLQISNTPAVPTPEPSTWILLLTGCAPPASARRFSWMRRERRRVTACSATT